MIFNVTEKIRYIGVDDTTLDLFESQYIVPNGISYNSYLIMDEKIAIMDTVDLRKSEEWWSNLNTALEGRTPDYLVVQHMEPDHSANIDSFLKTYPNATVVAGDIVNYSVTGTRRVDVNVQAAYTEDSAKVLEALLEAGQVEGILPDPAPNAVILAYTETAVQYSLRVWTKTEDYWDVMFAINRNVKNIFDGQQIKAAFPHVHVYMEK